MRDGNAKTSMIVSAAAGSALVLTAAILLAASSRANATPALANGKPCSTCHAGSPPSKSNVKS